MVELIVEDAVFVTMAPGAGPADGMLIRDGRIAVLGQAETVRAAAPGAEVARLGGATVIPGLIDAHCHVSDVGYLAAGADCSQPSAPGIPAIQARLRAARPPGRCPRPRPRGPARRRGVRGPDVRVVRAQPPA